MNIFLDNIIFSLQNSGGISVRWYEFIKRILIDPEINPKFLELPNENLFRAQITIPNQIFLPNICSKYPVYIQRYLNPKKIKGQGIFHSSYYRTVSNPNIPNITTLHDFTYEYFRNGLAKFVHHRQKESAIKNSKKIICNSYYTKTDLLKFYPKISPKNVNVIYSGVDIVYEALSNKNERNLKDLIDFSSGEYVLFIGDRKSLYKNFKTTIKACHFANVPLVMVGGGQLSKNENSYLRETLNSNNFKLLLNISNDQLNIIYNHALCLLYPSLYEGFGIPIIEAQRAGCPVISTNFSSIPEVAGKGAILLTDVTEFQIADMIKMLMKDSANVHSIREEGFKNSQRFSWDKCYQETKQVYKETYEEFIG